ncbi:unnamed protein product [Meganyctiphanes norvegica]|uniref:Uncharacterized protein n=1 Tax=Meganyctiphanes norvegica TaxID=48144 RepID=A0AAV2QEG7_MEGNR
MAYFRVCGCEARCSPLQFCCCQIVFWIGCVLLGLGLYLMILDLQMPCYDWLCLWYWPYYLFFLSIGALLILASMLGHCQNEDYDSDLESIPYEHGARRSSTFYQVEANPNYGDVRAPPPPYQEQDGGIYFIENT